MAFNEQEIAVFIPEFSKKISLYRGRGETCTPPPARSLRSLAVAPCLGCTTVTCISKGRRAHAPPPPLIGIKINKKGGVGDWSMPLHITYPLIQMAINVQGYAVFIHKLFYKSPYRGRGEPTPSPRLVASLPRFGPLLTNPGCTTVTGIAKGQKPTCPH